MVDNEYIDNIINKSSNNNQICSLLRSKSDEVIRFICDYLGIEYSETYTLMQVIYHYKEDIREISKCICGENRKYHCYGYRNTCGRKSCINEVREINKKKTCLKRYGKEYVTQVSEVKEKIRESIFDKYGVYVCTQSEEVLETRRNNNFDKYGYYETLSIPSVRDDISKTNLDRYGHISPLGSSIVREEIKKNHILKYGVDNPQKVSEIREKTSNTFIENRLNEKIGILDELGYKIVDTNKDNYLLECDEGHEFSISRSWLNLKIRNNITICNECMGIPSRSIEQEKLEKFIEENYHGNIISNDRSVLSGKELDIYLPDLKLAFEYNGLYWHSELYKEDKYHIDKTNLCESLGIKLIHIFEDEWLFKSDIIKSRILNLIGKSDKIYGRKCEVKEIGNNKEVRKFLSDNHIQGFVGSKVKIGLYYNNELVSLMTFGNLRKNMGQVSKEGSYELLRFCNKLNTTVVGGASKLFKYFTRNYNPEYILSYADRRWSDGNLYNKLGLEFEYDTVPNFFYTNGNKVRFNRFNFRKDKLISEGFDPNKTSRQIMLDRGYYRVYDSGSKKYSMIL